ncbi:hypothetical protein BGZ60DRAFT_435899 [Tricladium varicosporioides]|nr:hypothetical protein BGZ60DRAFT_435899 [Hymenoscyphus varicosporioides]
MPDFKQTTTAQIPNTSPNSTGLSGPFNSLSRANGPSPATTTIIRTPSTLHIPRHSTTRFLFFASGPGRRMLRALKPKSNLKNSKFGILTHIYILFSVFVLYLIATIILFLSTYELSDLLPKSTFIGLWTALGGLSVFWLACTMLLSFGIGKYEDGVVNRRAERQRRGGVCDVGRDSPVMFNLRDLGEGGIRVVKTAVSRTQRARWEIDSRGYSIEVTEDGISPRSMPTTLEVKAPQEETCEQQTNIASPPLDSGEFDGIYGNSVANPQSNLPSIKIGQDQTISAAPKASGIKGISKVETTLELIEENDSGNDEVSTLTS